MPQSFASGRPTVLITGGAGFIGSHLCDALIETNNVICIDNFITGDENNIELLLQNPFFEFIRHDIAYPIDLTRFPELKKFELLVQGIQEIYHLACPTSPKEFDKYPLETLLTNSHGTYNALQLAIQYKAKFLFTSSAAVYGELPQGIESVPESYFGYVDPIGPRSAYNEGKRFAESLVFNIGKKYSINAKIARVYRTYGPRMRIDDGRMTPDWIRNALDHKPLVVHGDLSQKTSFCFVTDVVNGLIRLMASHITGPINIGSTHVFTFREITDLILALTHSTSSIITDDALQHHHLEGLPDTAVARRELGWLPMIELQQGLKETIEHMERFSHYYGVDRAKIGQML